ncbi:MAG: histidine kinase [Desulfuromonas sp.]|nr:MAG: histidine kinase [Desulfuromonas sp.]
MHRTTPNLFKAIVESFSQGMYVLIDEEVIFLNQEFANIFGFTDVAPLLNRNMFSEIYPDPESLDLFKGMHEQMIREDAPLVSWAQASKRLDGGHFWLQVEARLIKVDGLKAIVGTFVDMTHCQYVAEAMVVTQQTLSRLLDAMEDRVYVVNSDHKIIYANRKMLESSCGDIDVDPCYKVCRCMDEPCGDCAITAITEEGKSRHNEFFNEKTETWYSSIEIPVRMPGHEGITKLAVARDITSRKESEQRVQTLTRRLLTAQEDERTTLSRELHDDLGQQLNAAKIVVGTLSEDLKHTSPDILAQLGTLTDILQNTIQSVRRLSAGLRPASLERLGLVETLREQCDKAASLSKLKVDFKAAGMKEVKLGKDLEINIYRIAQEALNNIVKHARASEVTIRLVASYPTLRLRISDNGVGFNQQAYEQQPLSHAQLGLLGMAERVELLGGKFSLKSALGKGTSLAVELPYQSSEPGQSGEHLS